MKWLKRLGIFLLILLMVSAGVAGALYWAAKSVPDFYEKALVLDVPPEKRKAAARQFEKRTKKLVESIQKKGEWSESFSAMQINSWLIEDDAARKQWEPDGISDPRVDFQTNLIRVGFKFDSNLYTGIVSLELIPRVKSPHQVEVEIAAVRAGKLSLPIERVLAQLRDQLKVEGCKLAWTTRDGKRIAVLTFPKPGPNDGQPRLKSITVRKGRLVINGASDPKKHRPGMRVLALPKGIRRL